MKKLAVFLTAAVLSMAVAAPLTVHAADKKAKSEVVMKMGNKLHLFHSGNVEAQKEIAVGDVITVYRVFKKAIPQQKGMSMYKEEEKEVGQVKVLSFIGEHYFEAEIVKGEIKIGDIAKKNATSLLVQPAK